MSTVRGFPRSSMPQRLTGIETAIEDHTRLLADAGRRRPPRYDRGREFFLGRTVAYAEDPSSGDTYPAPPANKFRVEFLDPSFTANLTEAWEDVTVSSRAGSDDEPVVALNTWGCYLPQGTRVWLLRRRPLASEAAAGREGCWFIVDADLPLELLIKAPAAGIPARSGTELGEAECDVQVPTGSDTTWNLSNPKSWTEKIFNVSQSAVAANAYGKAARECYGGLLIVDVESCGS